MRVERCLGPRIILSFEEMSALSVPARAEIEGCGGHFWVQRNGETTIDAPSWRISQIQTIIRQSLGRENDR